ncbi:hypothetical protein B0H15DRAFT_1027517 [Mycena belliarum]|uniref:Uncharacterized protein n=1 Tax=Mycena belliarum TaxID=1033014 RepID=A0AAD6TMS1_9AGAR|nr:hypothetical protein B0H15DRAFT_1027517 [Mycena belliae]
MASLQQTPSPTRRRTISDVMSAFGTKISRALSSEGQPVASQKGFDPETESITSTIVEDADRSPSRRRDSGYQSSGRGGVGNFRAVPTTDPASPASDVQEFPWPRGRDRAPVSRRSTPSRSTGRGGSGNYRSPPRQDPAQVLREHEVLRTLAEAERTAVVRVKISSGRGGYGNMSDSRSRSRSVDPVSSPTSMHLSLAGYSPSPTREQQHGGGIAAGFVNTNGYVIGNRNGGGR